MRILTDLDRIRCLSICPGAIRTPINTDAWKTPEAYKELMKLIPYKRIGEPEDIAQAAVVPIEDEIKYHLENTPKPISAAAGTPAAIPAPQQAAAPPPPPAATAPPPPPPQAAG